MNVVWVLPVSFTYGSMEIMEAALETLVVMLTASTEEDAVAAGATGYLQKETDRERLLAAMRGVVLLEDFDWSALITLDGRMLDAVFSLEFLARHEHVLLLGPRGSARASRPRPWATSPSVSDTPCASFTPTTSSGPWRKLGWTTRWSAPFGLS